MYRSLYTHIHIYIVSLYIYITHSEGGDEVVSERGLGSLLDLRRRRTRLAPLDVLPDRACEEHRLLPEVNKKTKTKDTHTHTVAAGGDTCEATTIVVIGGARPKKVYIIPDT